MGVGCREWGVGGTYRAVVGAEVFIVNITFWIIIMMIEIIISWLGRERWKAETG